MEGIFYLGNVKRIFSLSRYKRHHTDVCYQYFLSVCDKSIGFRASALGRFPCQAALGRENSEVEKSANTQTILGTKVDQVGDKKYCAQLSVRS